MIAVRELRSADDVRAHAIMVARRARQRDGIGGQAVVRIVKAPVEPVEPPQASAESQRISALEKQLDQAKRETAARIAAVKLALKQSAEAEKRERIGIPVSFICNWICQKFGVDKVELLSERRHREIVVYRQRLFWLAKKLSLASYPRIAAACNKRDHTTVLYAWEKLNEQAQRDASIKQELDDLASAVTAAWNAWLVANTPAQVDAP